MLSTLVGSFFLVFQASTEPARVVSVPAGDILVLEMRGEEELVAVYGVECYESTTPPGQRARQFTTERAKGKNVQVERISTRFKVNFVRIELPSGNDLGLELLKRGLARWDRIVARDEASYAEAEQAAKEAGAGIWNRTSRTSPGPKPTAADADRERPLTEAEKRLQSFKEQEQLKRLAAFEAEYDHWRRLSPDQRTGIIDGVQRNYDAAMQSVARDREQVESRIRSLRDRQQQIGETIASRSEEIDQLNQQQQEQLSELYGNSPAAQEEQLLQDILRYRQFSMGYDRLSANAAIASQQLRVREAMEQLNRIAGSISMDYETARQNQLRAIATADQQIRQLQGVEQQIQRARQLVLQREQQYRNTFEAQLQRLQVLQRTVNQGYEPQLRFEEIAVMESEYSGKLPPFEVQGTVWRLDASMPDEVGWRVAVANAETGTHVGLLTGRALPHERNLILEGPGSFSADVTLDQSRQYRLVVYEVH